MTKSKTSRTKTRDGNRKTKSRISYPANDAESRKLFAKFLEEIEKRRTSVKIEKVLFWIDYQQSRAYFPELREEDPRWARQFDQTARLVGGFSVDVLSKFIFPLIVDLSVNEKQFSADFCKALNSLELGKIKKENPTKALFLRNVFSLIYALGTGGEYRYFVEEAIKALRAVVRECLEVPATRGRPKSIPDEVTEMALRLQKEGNSLNKIAIQLKREYSYIEFTKNSVQQIIKRHKEKQSSAKN